MKSDPPEAPAAEASSILILADGRVLARNVTPAIAAILLSLQPRSDELAFRAGLQSSKGNHELFH